MVGDRPRRRRGGPGADTNRVFAGHRGRILVSAPFDGPVQAGPFVFLSIVASWVSLLAVGWALILWPHLPGNFLYQTGLDPSKNDGFLTALYVSLTTMTTLGYGDIVPTVWWLRVLRPLQALTGFAVLTAFVTWLLSIYPVLDRRRAFARDVHDTHESEPEIGNIVGKMGPDAATRCSAP